ncbi:hypothetical protein XENOCAPTIV_008404, partial [Xenoophorus captivus]
DLVLEELHLQGCKELTDYSVEILVKHQPNLLKLDISGCTELTSSLVVLGGVHAFCSPLSESKRCSLSPGLAELLSISSLMSLDLSECLHISGTELVRGLKESNAATPKLEALNLRSCTYLRVSQSSTVLLHPGGERENSAACVLSLQDLAVFSLAQLLRDSLRELDLTSCVNVTDLSVCAIATYLQKLEVLRLGWCKEVTDWGLLGMVQTSQCEPDDETVRTAAAC